MRTSNPIFKSKTFKNAQSYAGQSVMTIDGTINKTFLMFFILIASAGFTWTKFMNAWDASAVSPLMMIGLIGGLITALITVFNPKGAKITAPLYAFFEGLLLGGLSAIFETQYPGIVMKAVMLTMGTMGVMLFLYKSGIIQVTQKFRLGVIAATGGVALFYFLSFILSWFGVQMPGVFGSGLFGIGFSLLVVGIAALNLVLDFDFIDQGSDRGLPQFMEWYAAFGLMVTLIWLYIEILRLLAKLADRG
ncbi:MAG: Bax inhibitor-1/YccA family protein [Fidelibacterota bacterium]